MTISRQYKTLGYVGALVAALVLHVSCGDGDKLTRLVTGGGVTIDRTTQPLTIGDMEYLAGTYGPGCRDRSGEPWSAAIGMPTADPPHPPLSVQADNVGCTLLLTGVHTTLGVWITTTPISLGDAYSTELGAAFGPAPTGAPPTFYAKAKLSTTDFGMNFTIEFAFSDDPMFDPDMPVTPTPDGGIPDTGVADTGVPDAEVEDTGLPDTGIPDTGAPEAGTATATWSPNGVASPNYTFSVGSLAFSADAQGVVFAVTGALTLTPGTVLGDSYVLFDGPVGSSFEAIDEAYRAGTPVPISNSIPGSAIEPLVVGDRLDVEPSYVSIVIARTDPVTGVRAYQRIKLQFGRDPEAGP